MKRIDFGCLTFHVTEEGVLSMTNCYGSDQVDFLCHPFRLAICEFDVAGGTTSGFNRMCNSAETRKLRYVEHFIENNVLTLIQQSDIIEITSQITSYEDGNALRFTQTLKNISSEPLCLEMANTVGVCFGRDVSQDHKDYYFHKFLNSRYTEAMPDVRSLYDWGMQWNNAVFHVENVGHNSSYEYLPQGILENRKSGEFLMFQIESYYDWFYEITTAANRFILQIGGPTALRHAWNKVLAVGESYTTVPVALAGGRSFNQVIGEMTKYRRHIKPNLPVDRHLPSIYNEYMHYAWDNPYVARTQATAPTVAECGCEYYVIDCGWHNAKDITSTEGVYPLFGTWFEDRGRYPDGIRATAEYVRSLGMKFGLWIAPEVVGRANQEMLEYYDDTCFFMRNGKKIGHGTGYVLDFRHPKVYDYMTRTIDRMIDEYGCDYIKFDGCPNPGFGTEVDSTSLGDGLEKATEAFLSWTQDMMRKHPDVIFEDCAGGGQRMDYRALSIFPLVSTSDQTSYHRYPYITGNIFVSVLPEQAAVWSYPVPGNAYDKARNQILEGSISNETVAFNMINALLGRIHLASRIHLLDEEKQDLIKEGIRLYNKLTPEKLTALPYLPKGYTAFGDSFSAVGLKTENKVYLAVWNIRGERHVTLPLPEITVRDVQVIYPTTLPTSYSFDAGSLTLDFTEDEQARLFEITL
ncbi:MAG: alpha-galactosidase [Clostridia bacterium]|nr:alpha-galactosidase [Clostridia bacterium]